MTSRPHFQIPNKPKDRPQTPQVKALVDAYYALPGNEVGGNCHVVLEDKNLDTGSILWDLKYCEEQGDVAGAEIMRAMLQMTRTQRRKV